MTIKEEENATQCEVYQCPRTGASLVERDGLLVSDDGSIQYEMDKGIPMFLCHHVPESSDVEDRLSCVVEQAYKKSWKDAVRDVYGDWDYIFPDGRDKWLDLLSIDPESTVLEIGPGMGQFSPILSKRCKNFYAIEVIPRQAEFAAERCRQDGCENIHFACGGDDCRLPYKDSSFDWVVMNLVFEWCAMRDDITNDFASGQHLMLSEMNRVLKPGGHLYLLTKNRFALRLLIGKRDEHCYSMRWGNALPRPIMRFMLRRQGKSRPRGVLHSHNTLVKMLRDVGFGNVESYWATPEMRYPTQCVPTSAKEVREARRQPGFVQGEFRSTKALMRLIPSGMVKHFTPGLQMIAQKTNR